MIKVEYKPQEGYLHSIYDGDITKDDLINYIDATRLNKSYPRKLKILTDSTKANMLLSKADLELVIEANYKSLEQYDYIYDAIITSNPKETAFSMWFKKMSANNKYKFEVFFTVEAALKWLSEE